MNSKSYNKEEVVESIRDCERKYGKVTTSKMREDDNLIHPYYAKKIFGTFSNAKIESGINNVGQIHLTDKRMEELNNSIGDRKDDIFKGILMGDAWIDKEENKAAGLRIESVTKEFLEWLESVLGDVVSSLKKKNSAGELAEKNRSNGYIVNEENYNDVYILRTRKIKYFNKLNSWYDSGEKRFPEMELTPTILKMWYICDGSFANSRYPVVYSSNEKDRKEFILDMFKDTPLNPSFHNGGGGAIQFKTSESDTFFEYIGEPVPGFEYKWPEEFK